MIDINYEKNLTVEPYLYSIVPFQLQHTYIYIYMDVQ